jgi:hypothetical protein
MRAHLSHTDSHWALCYNLAQLLVGAHSVGVLVGGVGVSPTIGALQETTGICLNH